MSFWTAPGPSAFVERITRAIRMGKSVVIRIPNYCPKRLSTEIKKAFYPDLPLLQINASGEHSPIEFLYERLVSNSAPDLVRTAQTLVREPQFSSQIVWLEGIQASDWNEWKRFLLEYEHATRSVPTSLQTHLLIPLEGTNSLLQVPDAVGLETVKWDGFVRSIDMLLTSHIALPDLSTELESDLVTALSARLACWDDELCAQLVMLPLLQLVEPMSFLRDFGTARGWERASARSEAELWSIGMMQQFRGASTLHPAVVALRNDGTALQQMVWEAEVSVLMPYIERKRQELLRTYASVLTLPWTDVFGKTITDLLDLEIGAIEFQLSRNVAILREEVDEISELKQARNSLSHLEPVIPDVLARLCKHEVLRSKRHVAGS